MSRLGPTPSRIVKRVRPELRLGIIEAELIDLGGWDLLLEGAPIREWANRDALTPDPALQHLAGAVEAEMVGDHEAGDHGLAQAPTRFDQALIGAGDRVLGEHDPGDIWPKECLNDDADTRPSKQTDTLAVGKWPRQFAGHQSSRTAPGTSATE